MKKRNSISPGRFINWELNKGKRKIQSNNYSGNSVYEFSLRMKKVFPRPNKLHKIKLIEKFRPSFHDSTPWRQYFLILEHFIPDFLSPEDIQESFDHKTYSYLWNLTHIKSPSRLYCERSIPKLLELECVKKQFEIFNMVNK